MKTNTIFTTYLLSLLFISLIATGKDPVETKEIVGSGIFSTTINDIRNYTINQDTLIFLDKTAIGQSLYEIVGSGYKSRFRLLNDVNANSTVGTLESITLITDIKGIVTTLNPLTIMNQNILSTADTVLVNLNAVTDLLVGDSVEVSGYINQDNSLQVSRIEKKTALSSWMLRGYVTAITGSSSFNMADLNILSNGLTPLCPNSNIVVGDFLEIEATVDGSFTTGQPLSTLTALECQSPDIDPTPEGIIPAVIEGFVSQVFEPPTPLVFMLNDIRIETDDQTIFDNGETEHIDLGVNIEAQGLLDSDAGTLVASKIRFLQHRVKIKAPLANKDIILGQSITILGNLFLATPQTIDDDFILANGLTSDQQVEIRGFIDSSGQGYLLKVRDRGSVDFSDVSLRGDVSILNNPFITVLNTVIDATNSLIEDEENQVITLAELFAVLEVGSQIEIEDAFYDHNNNTLSGGTIEIDEIETEDDPDSATIVNTKEIVGSGIFSAGKGIATITRTTDIIFNSGFE